MKNNMTAQSAVNSSVSIQISSLFQTSLVILSLGLTASFLFESAGIVIAIAGVLVQAIVMMRMPEQLKNALKSKDILSSLFFAALIAFTIGMSIIGSNSILSSGINEDTATFEKRERLNQQIDLKMQAIAIFTEREMISTKAKPAEIELKALEAELDSLGTPSGLYLAAQNIFGATHAPTFITSFVLILSLLIDVVAMTPLSTHRAEINTVNNSENQASETANEPTGDSNPTPPKTRTKAKKQEPESTKNIFAFSTNSDVNAVIKAYKEGRLEKLIVDHVRPFLGCNRDHATIITREAKKLLSNVKVA